LAHRAAAGAQRDGGTVLWVDPSATFDPLAATRAGIDLERLIVVRAKTRDAVLLAAGAALRGDGFRLAVVRTGPQPAPGWTISRRWARSSRTSGCRAGCWKKQDEERARGGFAATSEYHQP